MTINPQPWRWSEPRVLVEHHEEEAGLEIASGLRMAGYAVAACCGPQRHGQCPVTGDGGCAAAEDADLVVCCLGYEHETAREVLRGLRMRYPATPLLVEAPSQLDAELEELLEGCHRLQGPATTEQIVSAALSVTANASDAETAHA